MAVAIVLTPQPRNDMVCGAVYGPGGIKVGRVRHLKQVEGDTDVRAPWGHSHSIIPHNLGNCRPPPPCTQIHATSFTEPLLLCLLLSHPPPPTLSVDVICECVPVVPHTVLITIVVAAFKEGHALLWVGAVKCVGNLVVGAPV